MKLNEVKIEYEDDRVIIGRLKQGEDLMVFVQPYDDGNWKGVAILEFACQGEYVYGWWYGSHCFRDVAYDQNGELINIFPEIAKFWKQNMMLSNRKMSDKEFEDSILNGYICEMSEGMLSLSHVG